MTNKYHVEFDIEWDREEELRDWLTYSDVSNLVIEKTSEDPQPGWYQEVDNPEGDVSYFDQEFIDTYGELYSGEFSKDWRRVNPPTPYEAAPAEDGYTYYRDGEGWFWRNQGDTWEFQLSGSKMDWTDQAGGYSYDTVSSANEGLTKVSRAEVYGE